MLWAAVIILGSLIAGYLGTLDALGKMSGPFGSGLGISALFVALLFAVPVVAGVLIFFEFTNNKMTRAVPLDHGGGRDRRSDPAAGSGRTARAAGAAGIREMGAAFGGGGRLGILEFIGFGISPGMVITVAGGVLIMLTQLGIVKLKGCG